MLDEPALAAGSLARFFNQPLDWAMALSLTEAMAWLSRMVRMGG